MGKRAAFLAALSKGGGTSGLCEWPCQLVADLQLCWMRGRCVVTLVYAAFSAALAKGGGATENNHCKHSKKDARRQLIR